MGICKEMSEVRGLTKGGNCSQRPNQCDPLQS